MFLAMKRKNLILSIIVLFVGVFSFSGCSTQKNYNMSFEQVISLLENQSKEMMEMFFNFDAQEKDISLVTKLDTDELNLDLDVKSQARIDYDSKMQDMFYHYFLNKGPLLYLKLSKFSLNWPSAKDLAMVNMVVNGFKWQRFKLGMSGLNLSKSFDLYSLYNERLWEIVDNVWEVMINQWSGVYDWIFDEYKLYNDWKYYVDEEKFDDMLKLYADMMNEFYSGLLAQYTAQNLWDKEVNLVDFNDLLSGITYDNLQWYFIIAWKNEVVETMEGVYMNVDWTWMILNYYYGKDWLYFEVKDENWEDLMLIVAKRNGRTYSVYANMMSVLWIKWDLKFNKFSKKDWIDIDFDMELTANMEWETLSDLENLNEIYMEVPFKWNYKVKNIDNFSLQEPSDAVDLMEMLGWYLWMWTVDEQLSDDLEWDYEYEYELFDESQILE